MYLNFFVWPAFGLGTWQRSFLLHAVGLRPGSFLVPEGLGPGDLVASMSAADLLAVWDAARPLVAREGALAPFPLGVGCRHRRYQRRRAVIRIKLYASFNGPSPSLSFPPLLPLSPSPFPFPFLFLLLSFSSLPSVSFLAFLLCSASSFPSSSPSFASSFPSFSCSPLPALLRSLPFPFLGGLRSYEK